MALIEAVTNVVVGYALAVVTQILVFPVFGWQPNLRAIAFCIFLESEFTPISGEFRYCCIR